jgi:S-formylglutathione hydrolase FrmB
MGGGAAFHTAIKYSDRFGVVVGFFPPLNVRWQDCHGNWNAPFDPCCWGWRTDLDRGLAPVGRFFGVYTVRARNVTFPLYGRGSPEIVPATSLENPIEMLDRYPLTPNQPRMFVAYAGRDEFNIGAMVDSFLYVARQRGIQVDTAYDPKGHHDLATARKLMPPTLAWLAQQLAAYKEQ